MKRERLTATALLFAAVCLGTAPALARQAEAGQTSPQPGAAIEDPEAAGQNAAPVLLGGEPVLWVPTGVGPYSAQFRAERIAQRLEDAVHDRSITDPAVTIREVEGSSELHVGSRLLMVVTPNDARVMGAPRAAVAKQFAAEFERAIRAERLRYAPATLIRSGIYGSLATVAFFLSVWLIFRVTRMVGRALANRFAPRSESLREMQAVLLADSSVGRTMSFATKATRLVLVLVLFDVYLTYVLGLFPWTRAVSVKLLRYAINPVKMVLSALVGYLPNLFFVLVISGVFYVAIKLVGLFFRKIEHGQLVFPNFPAEWADPTNKIVRVLLIAFGLVIAFPYLPASNSPAFAGVSVFVGVLFSLASSSALSNMIAGIVLTYTSAFRVGERVKVGDAFGDIVETSLLVTRVRTIKNENITIPNGIVLSSAVTNYSRTANTLGLILHTSVTIGYDAPWRKIHDLLIAAALNTPGVLTDPKPFVWQTALNDFYVTYEINAYIAKARDMQDIYADLHARIQDSFYESGVEIMSPHFTAIRDGNTIAIPESYRPVEYKAPSFRVRDVTPAASGLPDIPGTTRRG